MIKIPFRPALSASQKRDWDEWGFLHLKGAITAAEIETVRAAVDWHWAHPVSNPHHVDVITGEYAGHCFAMSDTPPEVRAQVYKLNNLFLNDDAIRSVALSPLLKEVFQTLLGAEPMICNSLNFERGSQQDAHIDSWYMPPPVDGGMIAASISLDAVDDSNGPIFFYPGSHKIPPYRFSDGRLNVVESEFDRCRGYLDEEIAKRNLKRVRFSGKPGDVFVWHGQLIHGGSPINDFKRTRASLVVHYWRAPDVGVEAVRRDREGRAYLGHTLRGEITHAAA